MSYHLTVQKKSTYLHFTISGENTRENVAAYLEEIRQECAAQKCFRVLIEERLEGPRLGMMDVFAIAGQRNIEALGSLDVVAFVDVNASGTMMRFAETVSRNRGVSFNVFPSVAKAEAWLGSVEGAGSRQ